MKVIDESRPHEVPPSMLLHGVTGSGKSTWATTGGKPLVILTEPKAESVLRSINPQAVGLVPESLDDLDKLLAILGTPERMTKFDRVVLDSYTELTINLPRWILARANKAAGVITQLEIQEFGTLRDYGLAVVKAIQLTGLPSVIIGRSVSKLFGKMERIQPDGTGKSVNELPGKLLPTAEARFDLELGYVIDSTPVDYSQRCGVPWVPAVWKGSCLDYLSLVKAGPGEAGHASRPPQVSHGSPPQSASAHKREGDHSAKTADAQPSQMVQTGVTVPSNTPGADDPEWVALVARMASASAHLPVEERQARLRGLEQAYVSDSSTAKAAAQQCFARGTGPDPEKDPKGFLHAFGEMCREIQAANLAKAKERTFSPETEAFVEGVSPTLAKAEDIRELLDFATAAKVNMDALWAYALKREGARPTQDGTINWHSLTKHFVATITPHLKDPNKRRAFVAGLHQKFNVNA